MRSRGMGSGTWLWTRPLPPASSGYPPAPGKARAATGEEQVGTQGPAIKVQEPHPLSETSGALSRAGRYPPPPPPPPLPSLTAAALWLALALSAPLAPARRALCAHFSFAHCRLPALPPSPSLVPGPAQRSALLPGPRRPPTRQGLGLGQRAGQLIAQTGVRS